MVYLNVLGIIFHSALTYLKITFSDSLTSYRSFFIVQLYILLISFSCALNVFFMIQLHVLLITFDFLMCFTYHFS